MKYSKNKTSKCLILGDAKLPQLHALQVELWVPNTTSENHGHELSPVSGRASAFLVISSHLLLML